MVHDGTRCHLPKYGAYGERRSLLINRLDDDFPDVGTFVDHQAGMQVVLHLNADLVDYEIATKDISLGAATTPLSAFCREETHLNGLILGFCSFSPREIENGLTMLKRAFV